MGRRALPLPPLRITRVSVVRETSWQFLVSRATLRSMGVRLRPRGELAISETAELLLERAESRLRSPSCSLCGLVSPTRIELHVPPSRKHLWSPELRIDVRQEGEQCRLVGTYGPHPHVWTLFVGVYAVLAFLAFLAVIFAVAQWTLQSEISALYVLLGLLLLAVGARLLAFVGQGLGRDQIVELRAFLDEVIAEGAPQSSAPRRSGVRAAGAPTTNRDRAVAER